MVDHGGGVSHRVLFAVAPQLRSFTIEGSLLEESFKNSIATWKAYGTLAQAASRLDPSLKQEVSRVKIRTHIVVPVVVVLVHPGNNRVRRRIGSRGETSSTAGTRMVGGRHASNHTAVKVAVGPVASLEVSWHDED